MEQMAIYNKLLGEFGPQGWWPATQKNGLHPVYSEKNKFIANLSRGQRLEIILGAILAQNTSWKNATKAIAELKKRKLIDAEKILEIENGELGPIIRSAGYFNQKAERLKLIAEFIINENGLEKLDSLPTNELRGKLLAIRGIGPETADSILVYAFGRPSFVIDAYTKRVFSRMGFCDADMGYKELQEFFHKKLLSRNEEKDAALFNEFHALLVELAKHSCTKKAPKCGGCPLGEMCKKVFN